MTTLSEKQVAAYRRSFQKRLDQRQAQGEEKRVKALTAVSNAVANLAMGHPSIQCVYLFGSIIRPGQFHSSSDIDLAVSGASPEAYFSFWRDLEAALPEWEIDLRDISDLSFFSDRIQKTGKLLYERTNSSAASRDT